MIDVSRRLELFKQGYWEVPDFLDTSEFDFTWRPDPYDRPYIHQFGTQHQKTGGPRFVIPESEGIKYQSHQIARRLPDTNNRCWRPLINNCTVDYSWHPDDTEPPFIYVFGNQWYDVDTMPSFQYRVKGATEKKYMYDIKAMLLPEIERWYIPDDISEDFDYSWRPHPHEPSLIHQFGTQWQKTGGPRYTPDDASVIKYNDIQVATRLPSLRRWTIPESIDMDSFDFSWHPDDTEPPYMYEFGTQWQKTGGPIYSMRNATVKKYCDIQTATRLPMPKKFRVVECVNDFDYSWHPDETEEPYTYVFGNEYFTPESMPTIIYRQRDSVGTKYMTDIVAKLSINQVPCIDSIFDEVVNHQFSCKYVHFYVGTPTLDYKNILPNTENKPYLHILNECEAIVPSDVVYKLYDKLSDYHEVFYHRYPTKVEPLDIVFFSNGESCAEDNYNHLVEITKNLPNKIHRIDRVVGRVKSQHAAANISTTPWYFLVNAKLKVNDDFDFSWQPNRMKSSRHYIFTCTNPVNGLEYGHQAIVANNRKLTLNTEVKRLDYTMDSPTEVVKINSGVSTYNSSEYDTWRTSFRECIKLKYYNDEESKHRLECWSTVGNGNYGNMSILGAKNAMEYYDSVNGGLEKLMLTYDWAWLYQHYCDKYMNDYNHSLPSSVINFQC
jgi:hypothetical protein